MFGDKVDVDAARSALVGPQARIGTRLEVLLLHVPLVHTIVLSATAIDCGEVAVETRLGTDFAQLLLSGSSCGALHLKVDGDEVVAKRLLQEDVRL